MKQSGVASESGSNYLWSRPAKPVASIRDGVTDVLAPHVLARADPNTYAIATIATWLAGRSGREGSRPMTDFSSPRRTDQPAKRSATWRVLPDSDRRWLAANVRGQPDCAINQRRSTGLRTPSGPRLSTCVYTIVVLRSAWPSSSCTVRMSYPASSRCAANECRHAEPAAQDRMSSV
jgi:hypothetical protein